MKVLIIGSGGREHAIGLKLKDSPRRPTLMFAPGNPGMEALGQCYPLDDIDSLRNLALEEKADLTIVGPEVPLVEGIVDAFEEKGLKIFGPNKAAARLEGSKAFSKDFMQRYGIPTAEYRVFTERERALDSLREKGAPIVVKASGLAAGKGALVCQTLEDAEAAVESMLGSPSQFGEAGKEVVIEEFMTGEEASIFAVCDGKDYVLLPASQDHKRSGDGDTGLNTGGMGAYAPAPLVTESLLRRVEQEIIKPTLAGMAKEGCPYSGILYVGIMVTPDGPKVVEYNCRLGDPEAQVVLPVMRDDLLALADDAVEKRLASHPPREADRFAAIVVMTAGGYPGSYAKGKDIQGLEAPFPPNAYVVQAGTRKTDSKIVTSGGRVLGVVGTGPSLQEAIAAAYSGVDCIHFEEAHYRKDIGKKGLQRLGVT